MVVKFCVDSLEYSPIERGSNFGVVRVISSIISVFVSLVTIFWIKRNQLSAQKGDAFAVKSVIFPVFVKLLWFSAFIDVYYSLIILFVPFPLKERNSLTSAITYALTSSLQHGVTEGIAFLLLQKGCGQYAAMTAFLWTAVWMSITFAVFFFVFFKGFEVEETSFVVSVVWDCSLSLFYIVLWLAPQEHMFRRPAAILYARFWAIFRLVSIIVNCFEFVPEFTDYADCGYLFIWLIAFPCLQPVVCYWTLLQDSRWWQGLDIYQGRRTADKDNILSPLMGSDFTIECAQSLADTLDQIRGNHSVKMLNFACIKVDVSTPLGSGSFSKVYKGSYRGQEYAVKMIYTMDLTVDVIRRVAAEASILSSLQHPNVVRILGVCVLPPSVCLLLELCSFGSLSDIIRGYGFNWSNVQRQPPMLSPIDKLYLACGCARGLAAIHSLNPTLCHRDVKSFNFLVDSQLNAKISDLELGSSMLQLDFTSRASIRQRDSELGRMTESDYDSDIVVVEDLLANWLAPEVIQLRRFQQESDVFALAVVLWEIVVGELPYRHEENQASIRRQIVSGYRLPLPPNNKLTPVIRDAWQEDLTQRPTAEAIATRIDDLLDNILGELGFSINPDLNFSALVTYLERRHGVSRSTTSSWLEMGQDSLELHRLPPTVPETIISIRGDKCWEPFASQDSAWAVITSTDPFAILFWNNSWFNMFSTCANVILAPSICNNTIPIIAFGDILADSSDLSVVSKFCHSLQLSGRATCVLDLGPAGLCSLHAYPIQDNGYRGGGNVSFVAIQFNTLLDEHPTAPPRQSPAASVVSARYKLKSTRSRSAASFAALQSNEELDTFPRRAQSVN